MDGTLLLARHYSKCFVWSSNLRGRDCYCPDCTALFRYNRLKICKAYTESTRKSLSPNVFFHIVHFINKNVHMFLSLFLIDNDFRV